MTVATLPPVVTATNVRAAAPELGPLVVRPDYYAYRRPHPCAVPDGRSLWRQAWDDLAVRWLGYTGVAGWGGVLLWWALVGDGAHWLAFGALPPWAVAMWQNHRRHGLPWAKHRRGGL